MPEAVIHPTPQELTAFGLGKLPERAAAVVAAHLEVCPACRQVVVGVMPDSFLDKVRAAGPGGSSFPPGLAQPGNAPSSAGRPAMPAAPYPNLPPELANHPKYRILRELGRGGMGVVYQARQTGMMDRQVVIKVINRALLDNPDALERFLREVRAAAQLSHPNIVTAYDAEQAGELHMLVMEFVPGQNLAEVLQKKGPLPVASACQYARQAAWALQHADERGMVHRDIKPQNLMLTPKGQVKVLDFGLAKVVSEQASRSGLTSSNSYMGTPEYSAPEQATDARTADIRADLYSLGCTLYCLLSGRPPFREETAMKTILAHLQKQPQPLPALRPEVPERLWKVIARLLAKEPDKRYQKPVEVVQALAPFVKPVAKADAKGVPAPASDVGSPVEGTRIAADASQIKKILREVPGKTPPREVPTKDEAANPFENLVDAPALPRKGARESTKRVPAVWFQLWLMLAGAGIMLLALVGVWASRVFTGASNKPTEERSAELAKSIINSIDMKLVLVKPGTFSMGSPLDEAERGDDEEQHRVEITRPFYVGVYEVTQEQYRRVMGHNPSHFSSAGSGKDEVKGRDTRQFPVENVSWEEAVKFCQKLSEQPNEKSKGRVYRLPTEAEWEYVCRGGHLFKKPSPPFHFGNSFSSDQANFNGNVPYGAAKGPYLQCTTKVGSYDPNPLGLYDLHGNVYEWYSDRYDEKYYQQSPRQDPQGPETGGDRNLRVARGGSWFSRGGSCRAAYRNYNALRTHSDLIGFRVVLVVGARN